MGGNDERPTAGDERAAGESCLGIYSISSFLLALSLAVSEFLYPQPQVLLRGHFYCNSILQVP